MNVKSFSESPFYGTEFFVKLIQIKGRSGEYTCRQEERMMGKGYYVAGGYMGYVDGTYMLFADEDDYWEYLEAA